MTTFALGSKVKITSGPLRGDLREFMIIAFSTYRTHEIAILSYATGTLWEFTSNLTLIS